MKSNKGILAGLVIIIVGLLFYISNVPKPKPIVSPDTVVMAKFKISTWDYILSETISQAKKISTNKLDSAQIKLATDTISAAMNVIVNNLNDTAINPVFKKN